MSQQDDAEILAIARAGFLDEAADVLLQFEQALLVMESDPQDAENLNAAFRAAHTIKGTAGLFGCEAVVAFTHEVETLMDALREGQLPVSAEISAALLESRDQIEVLMGEVRSGVESPAVAERSVVLGQLLRALRGSAGERGTPRADAAAPSAASGDDFAQTWHLSLRFGTDALRNGLDPLAFVRYLGKIGSVTHVHFFDDAVPALEALDAEACHVGLEMRLCTAAGRDEIEQVFEFAIDDCSLQILPPLAPVADYRALQQLRSGGDAEAAQQLQAVWTRMGVALHDAPEAPAVERRVPAPDRRQDSERRENLPDRRGAAARDKRPGEEARYVKVRADKLDHLIDLIGELVIAGSGAQMVATQEAHAGFLEATQRVADLVQSTRDAALALRMVPVGETFARFQRVVRDTSKQLGKEIELVITGGDTELDKSMVEVIADPLMHLVRNSLDHGIEGPDERQAAGKPRTGRLGLNAYHEGGSIVIEVSDDGAGLRRERILAKAVERGLVAPDAQLADAEVWQLIFAPGFSTADQVTDLSGRGVGMDVVRRNIEALRGQISLASHAGQGTTTLIRLPLTLAMIDGFLTLVGGVHFVLPLAVVSECIDLPRECREHPDEVCGTFDLRGEVLPFLDLARFYGFEASSPASASARPARRSLVVVRDGNVRIGLAVDRLLGEHQTVIKPLAGIFRPLQALAGSTILGSGDVALVLDMQGVMAAATRAQHPAPARRVVAQN